MHRVSVRKYQSDLTPPAFVAAKDDEYRRFSPYAPQWAGGPFGRVGVQAGYWYMQLKDVIDERRYGKAA